MSSHKILLMILCVWLLAAHCSLTSGQKPEEYPSPHGPYWCLPCQPGFLVTQHCTKDLTSSSCMPCPNGTYEDGFNSNTFCKPCTLLKCPPKHLPLCSETQAKCVCEEGYYKISTNSSNDECRALSKCQSGQGEVFHGNSTHDRICVGCVVGFEFVDRQDAEHPVCRQCSVCQSSEILFEKCTLDTDTKCEPFPMPFPEDKSTQTLFLTNTGESAALNTMEAGHMTTVIIVLIVAIVLIIIAIIVIFVWWWRRKRNVHNKKVQQGNSYVKGNRNIKDPQLNQISNGEMYSSTAANETQSDENVPLNNYEKENQHNGVIYFSTAANETQPDENVPLNNYKKENQHNDQKAIEEKHFESKLSGDSPA